ncbi:outer membrane protein [Rhodoligotrophos defluvii]|uniref:outer membrane protein n=1 Tax=Rhodoligotrophos defluvii TaxID=2561934 RepID=UPI0010CA1098|nr:outer membrane beta-barrel protein [Rhodoligotrophos defluvii]
MRNSLAVASVLAFTCAASAADLDQPESASRWAGLYGGIHFSTAWGKAEWRDPTGLLTPFGGSFPADGASEGVASGGQIGYSRQLDNLLVGLEGRVGWTNLEALVACGAGENGGGWICRNDTDLLAALTARAGYDLGRVLVYVKAGPALKYSRFNIAARNTYYNIFRGDRAELGWTAGAGLEFAIDDRWSAQAEFAAYEFGTAKFRMRDQAGSMLVKVSEHTYLATVGLNYRLWAPTPAYLEEPIAEPSLWQGSFGVRYWVSAGKFRYAWERHSPLSALTYRATGHTGEAFGRLDYAGRLFLKGYFGGGALEGGQLTDEDFPPVTEPYSRTLSDQRDGRVRYASIDLGLVIWDRPWLQLGAYAGYHFLKERYNGFGCEQVAVDGPFCLGPVLSRPAHSAVTGWHSLRIGATAEWRWTDRLALSLDAAYLPASRFEGDDLHLTRPDIVPWPIKGTGDGVQIDAVLSYRIGRNLKLGAGGRYWHMNVSDGKLIQAEATARLYDLLGERYGFFLQASYDFGT